MEYKLFDTPKYNNIEFYKDIEMTDHINQFNHSLRLYISIAYILWVAKFNNIKTIGDFGCGNGGLIEFLSHNLPNIKIYGYDLIPANVAEAQRRSLDVKLKDFICEKIDYPDLLILTEILEHLAEPRIFLQKIPKGTFIMATVPFGETLNSHWQHHLWIWDGDSFFKMIEECGFKILQRGSIYTIQIVVAIK